MKIALIAVLISAAGFQSAAAQQDRGNNGDRRGPPPPGQQLEALGLSDAQQQEVELILASHHAERRAMRDSDATCEDRDALRASLDESLSSVLTKEQMLTFEEQKPPRPRKDRNSDPCHQENSQ